MDPKSAGMIQQELASAALSCVALVRARSLAEWVGTGRNLTESGVIRPAEAVQACQALGIELPGPRLRSALDVDELMRDWLTAAAAGFLEISGRRARASPDLPGPGPSGHVDPEAILTAWVTAAMAVLDLGDEPCEACLAVIHELYTTAGPVTMEQLESALLDTEEPREPEGVACPECGQVHELDDLRDLIGFLDDDAELDDTAAQHAETTVSGLQAFGAVDTSDGAVRLTLLGGALAAGVFEGRAPAPEVQELLAFAESAGVSERAAAVVLASDVGLDAAPAWREWARRPGMGAYAREWLRNQGEDVAEDAADEGWLATEALSLMLDRLAGTVPRSVLQALLAEQAGGEIAQVAELVMRSGHPRAAEVVALLTGPAGKRRSVGSVLYQLKITLRYVDDPPVWRRVLVPAGITLRDLHDALQRVMGWEGGHLYVFSKGRQEYGLPDPRLGFASDQQVLLSEVLPRRGSKLLYTYDIGDDWEHDIVVEDRRPMVTGEAYPVCVEGRGACPAEDCGGAPGWDLLKEIVASPSHEDHLDRLDWLGLDTAEEFGPDEFSVAEANARLSPLAQAWGLGRS